MTLARAVFGLLLAVALATPEAAAGQRGDGTATVVYLVRHAEKATDHPTDPTLTEEGTARAELLARMLGDAGIEHVHSTPFRRTRLTVEPLATRLGLPVMEYPPDGLAELASRLEAAGGRHLVSGHSNTTPELVELLGGEPGEPIVEATEYDRLYILTIGTDGTVSTTLLRFGAAGVPEAASATARAPG